MTLIADLRLRIVTAFLLVTCISQMNDIQAAALMFGLAMSFALLQALNAQMWHRLLHIEGFVALLAITLPFTIPGHEIFSLGPLSASVEGLTRAAVVGLKITTSSILILSLLAREEPERIGSALHQLKMPATLTKMFVLMVRYLSLIRSESQRLRDAMKARSFIPRSDRHTWTSYGRLIGMILLRAMERAARVEEAMRCRGYTGRLPHAALPAPRALDWMIASVLVFLSIGVLLWDRT